MALTDYKASEIFSGFDISSLSDRPNEDGITSAQLKARFDYLIKDLIPLHNSLINALIVLLEGGNETNGHKHNVDNLIDGTTNRLFTETLKLKLDGIASGAEVNQNAFSSIKVGSSTGNADSKTATFEIVSGSNIIASIDPLTNKVTLSATGDISTLAVQSILDDIGNYYNSLEVNGALQEIGAILYPSLAKTTPVDADTMLIVDSQDTDKYKKITWASIKSAIGSALGSIINALAPKTTPVDNDMVVLMDSASSNGSKKLSWSNIKTTLKSYFDTLYQAVLTSGTTIKTINETSVLGSGNISVQPTLVSGTNIKTINGSSVLGSGDLPISSGWLKNWIINGMFDVWQRGTSQTTSGYGSDDRWSNNVAGATQTVSRQEFTIGQTTVPNNPKYFSRTVVVDGGIANSTVEKIHKIEDVTKFSGKTITYSFWAKADANKNIAVEIYRYYGSGGSGYDLGISVQKFALTTSWQRFTKTITLPSVSGKTIGDNNCTHFSFWFDAGSNYASRTDSLGNQSGTFDIANVSLVEGSVAVECQNQPYADVLRDCQRYYYRIYGTQYSFVGNTSSTNTAFFVIANPVKMRTIPTSFEYSGLQLARLGEPLANIGSMSVNTFGIDSSLIAASGTGFPAAWSIVNLIIPSSSTYLAFSAEL